MSLRLARALLVSLACPIALASACKQESEDALPTLTREELMDPETCKDCHPKHYREWKSSMHAYAADDPVFIAMNAKGQEETDGALGDFCVKCHAPMAVYEGETVDGTNVAELPQHLKGVTCYFCHNAIEVNGEHNAEVVLADDTTMRGSLEDPARPSAHGVAYSRLHDGYDPESSKLCGGCHDIVTPNGVHLERTFAEYKGSAMGDPESPGFLSCSACHMRGRTGLAAKDENSSVGQRVVHEHLWPAVDIALTEWPDRALQRAAIEECALAVGTKSYGIERGESPIEFSLLVETNAGHNQPSGASQDRRLWVELKAYDANGELICSSRAVPDGVAVADFRDERPCAVGGATLFRDVIYDADGMETHDFWDAAKSELYPDGYVSTTLPPAPSLLTPHAVQLNYTIVPEPARIEVRMRMRPMDFDVLQPLVDDGYLDAAVLDEIPTFTLNGTQGVWEDGRYTPTGTFDCDSYVCEIDPTSPGCE